MICPYHDFAIKTPMTMIKNVCPKLSNQNRALIIKSRPMLLKSEFSDEWEKKVLKMAIFFIGAFFFWFVLAPLIFFVHTVCTNGKPNEAKTEAFL